MTKIDIANEIYDLQIEAEKVNSLQMAIAQAVLKGDWVAETYEWAFCALGDLTFSLKNKLMELEEKI